jgi:ABC-type multidrug transport system fused ATPase/permease subunit
MGNNCSSHSKKNEENINNFCDDVHDIYNNIDHVLISGNDHQEMSNINKQNEHIYEGKVNNENCTANLKVMFSFIYFLIMVIMNGMCLKLYYEGKIDKTIVITLFFMILALIQQYDTMIYEVQNITYHIGNYKQMEAYFNNFAINDQLLKNNISITNGHIVFKNIKMNYNNKHIFNNFNLEINANNKICIIGKIGSGKSSLLKILSGLIPYDGDIYIDNQNIKEYEHSAIIKNIAYIPQVPKLFNRTILENLNYGTNKNINDINNILTQYNLLTFFNKFEKGLYTIVGKDGEKLSGGQRQLIYILRSLIQNKKILLLDEPTASLDVEYTNILINIIKKINNKTIIVVTHDENIISVFDKVIELDKGNIINEY